MDDPVGALIALVWRDVSLVQIDGHQRGGLGYEGKGEEHKKQPPGGEQNGAQGSGVHPRFHIHQQFSSIIRRRAFGAPPGGGAAAAGSDLFHGAIAEIVARVGLEFRLATLRSLCQPHRVWRGKALPPAGVAAASDR